MGNEVKDVIRICPTPEYLLKLVSNADSCDIQDVLESGRKCVVQSVFDYVDEKKLEAITKREVGWPKIISLVLLYGETVNNNTELKQLLKSYDERIKEWKNACINNHDWFGSK